ncbi:hypothetical protein ACRQ5D_33990 [Mucilaginibacter sp. P25]|uniref:hypothetical protein n=1 Tax=Mucilaginibacter sp. P25 TaxID=3423945 RepID=UPI003D7B0CDD
MEQPEDILFRTTSNITVAELQGIHGDLLPTDIVLTMAENKNFDAAKAEFETWDDTAVYDMQYFLNVAFPHKEWLNGSADTFIARGFVMKLIDEHNGWPREIPGQPLSADVLTLRRLAGFLPHIDLAGEDFTIDWRLKELRETAKPWNSLRIREMELSPEGGAYLAFYDKKDHRLYKGDPASPEVQDNMVIIKIPNELTLDPVAVGWECGLNDLSLLAANPIREKLVAQVIPVKAYLSAGDAENKMPDENDRTNGVRRMR